MSLVPWKTGKPLVWDFTCRDTLTPSYLSTTAVTSGAVAAAAEKDKMRTYRDLIPHFHFIPISVESMGTWSQGALNFLKDVGRKIAATTRDPRATEFLFQRLSVTIARGNAASILDTLPSVKHLEELLFL
jgi:hypothetical protein